MSHPAIYKKSISAIFPDDVEDKFNADRISKESSHRLKSTSCRKGKLFSKNKSSNGGKRGT